MLALISSALGLLGGALPQVFQMLRARQDQAHELAILRLQLERDAQAGQQRLAEIEVQGDIAEQQALSRELIASIDAQSRASGVRWIDALSSSVRPSITYLFVLDYLVVKAAQFSLIVHDGTSWMIALPQLFNEFDQSVLMAVISFWFGSRAFSRHRQGAN